jgi:hypothetical protein
MSMAQEPRLYLEIGASVWNRDNRDLIQVQEIHKGPIGVFKIGAEFGSGVEAYWLHQSSIPYEYDQGLDAVYITKRWYLN